MAVKEREANVRKIPYAAPDFVKLQEFRAFGEAVERGRRDIVFFAEHFLGMTLHEGQKEWLRKAIEKTNILVPANRWGKTTVAAIKHIHYCFYKIGIGTGNPEAWGKASYTTVNLSPHSDTTRPVFEAIIEILTSSFVITEIVDGVKQARTNNCIIGWLLDKTRIRNTVPLHLQFTNNTDIMFRSTGEDQGKSIEGRSYGYVSYDEGGQSHHLEFERTRRILPRLGQMNGPLDIISTPEISSPSILEHYELFQKGGGEGHPKEDGFYSQEGSIEDNHFFLASNPGYVEDMKQQMRGNPVLQQILYGKFVFAGSSLYPGEDIQAAKDDELSLGKAYEDGHQYVVGVDTAMGKDEMVFTVIDVTTRPFRVVRQLSATGNTKSPEIHEADFEALVRSYLKLNNLRIILETFNGESANFYKSLPWDLQMLTFCWGSWQPEGLPAKDKTRRRGIKKPEVLLSLRQLLAKREIKLPNEPTLVKQLSIYREDDTNIPTDRVISLALACWLATDGAPKTNNEVIEIDL